MTSMEKGLIAASKQHSQENEIRLLARLKNNRLLKIREAMKMNQREFAELLDLAPVIYGRMENLAFFPVNKRTNEWNATAQKIAKKLRLPEDYIWPEVLRYIEKTKIEREINAVQMKALLEGQNQALIAPQEVDAATKDIASAVDKMLKTLSPREEMVMRKRYGFLGDEMTLQEIGDEQDVGRNRIREIEQKALAKLKHPSRRKKVRDLWD